MDKALTPEDAVERIRRDGIEWVDLQVTDLSGRFHHVTISSSMVTPETLEEGFGKLDGSSVRGFATIDESDLVLKPVLETYAVLPWFDKTARFITQVYGFLGSGRFIRDPRYVSERLESKLSGEGLTAYVSVEPEFFIFDSMKFRVDGFISYYKVESREAYWNGGGGARIRTKEGYYPTPPLDQMMQVRQEIASTLRNYFGVEAEVHHHEVATAGQAEVNFRYSTPTRTSDNLQTLKYVARMVAYRRGLMVTFMPKVLANDNGSGMHTHVSIWRDGTNLFYDPSDEYSEISQYARYFIGGLIEHGRALSAFVSPTVNSYRRLIPGYEAPVYLAWSRANRSAAIRIPSYFRGDQVSKRIEYRPPDPTANPYLALPAIILAGLDGVKKKIDPGDPVDENIYMMTEQKRRMLGIKTLPRSLDEALDELETDNEFLKPVFNKEIIQTYIDMKREESQRLKPYPHPAEVYLYHDA